MDGSSARLPYVALLSLSIIAGLPRVVLLFLIHLLQHTHYTLSPHALLRISRFITTCFVVLAPDDSVADLVHLRALLCSDFIYFFRSNKNWKITRRIQKKTELFL